MRLNDCVNFDEYKQTSHAYRHAHNRPAAPAASTSHQARLRNGLFTDAKRLVPNVRTGRFAMRWISIGWPMLSLTLQPRWKCQRAPWCLTQAERDPMGHSFRPTLHNA